MAFLILDLDLTTFIARDEPHPEQLNTDVHTLSDFISAASISNGTKQDIRLINVPELSKLIQTAYEQHDGVIILTAGCWMPDVRNLMADHLALTPDVAAKLRHCLFYSAATDVDTFHALSNDNQRQVSLFIKSIYADFNALNTGINNVITSQKTDIKNKYDDIDRFVKQATNNTARACATMKQLLIKNHNEFQDEYNNLLRIAHTSLAELTTISEALFDLKGQNDAVLSCACKRVKLIINKTCDGLGVVERQIIQYMPKNKRLNLNIKNNPALKNKHFVMLDDNMAHLNSFKDDKHVIPVLATTNSNDKSFYAQAIEELKLAKTLENDEFSFSLEKENSHIITYFGSQRKRKANELNAPQKAQDADNSRFKQQLRSHSRS